MHGVAHELSERERVAALAARGRAAMRAFAGAGQARVDEAVTALAWSIYKPEHAKELAELAVRDTGMGNVADKITKNRRKTFGTLRDLLRARTVGVIEELPALGLVKYAKPVGLVAAVTPSTNPSATAVNKAMMAVKGRNAVIVSPSPGGLATGTRTVELMREGLERIGAPADLVQVLPGPATKSLTRVLMEACDLVVATGSQSNVRAAHRSGTPAIGVGAGNVPVIIDETADLDAAARKICASKSFDNATSCSSENSLIILDAVYDAALRALQAAGGYLADGRERDLIARTHWEAGGSVDACWRRLPRCSRARRACRSTRGSRGSSWWRKPAPARSTRSPTRSSRWSWRCTACPTSPRPSRRPAPSSTSGAAATPAASIPRTWRARGNWRSSSTSCACWSTWPTLSATAEVSIPV